jgi:hypothetical protein
LSIKSDGIARRFLPEEETNMNFTTWMKPTFADALSSGAATQVEGQEPKRKSMRIVNGFLTWMIVLADCLNLHHKDSTGRTK